MAVSGSNVYVAGLLYNNTSNANGVLFGGTGTTAGTRPQLGASTSASNDLVLAKYTDNGPTATLGWTQVGGGSYDDQGLGLAVSGNNLYVTGYLPNTTANTAGVLFGGTGTMVVTVPVNGLGASHDKDFVLAHYTDGGTSGSFQWIQVGGGAHRPRHWGGCGRTKRLGRRVRDAFR